MVTRPHGNVTSPAHFPRRFAAAGGERTHSLALRARTRWRVLHTSTQRQQVDRAFRAPRFRSLTDPLACASSSCALARPPYKHAARASGSGVSVLAFPRRSRLGVRELVTAFWSTAARKQPSSHVPDLPTPICDSDTLCPLRSPAFRRFPQQCRPRQEPRKTRITRKVEQVGLAHAALRVSIPSVPKGRI